MNEFVISIHSVCLVTVLRCKWDMNYELNIWPQGCSSVHLSRDNVCFALILNWYWWHLFRAHTSKNYYLRFSHWQQCPLSNCMICMTKYFLIVATVSWIVVKESQFIWYYVVEIFCAPSHWTWFSFETILSYEMLLCFYVVFSVPDIHGAFFVAGPNARC